MGGVLLDNIRLHKKTRFVEAHHIHQSSRLMGIAPGQQVNTLD